MSDWQDLARSALQRIWFRRAWKARQVSRAGLAAIAALLLTLGLAGAAMAGGVNYTYDALGRLSTVVYSGGANTTTLTYSYDAAGNRTLVTTTSP